MALLNSFNGYYLLPSFPDWADNVQYTLRWSGQEDQTLRSNEERFQFRELPRADLEFSIWPAKILEAQNIGDIKRFLLDQAQAKICVPLWVRPAIVNAAAAAASTSIVVDTAAALCPAFAAGDVIFIPNPSGDGSYETRTLTSVTGSGTTLNFSGGLVNPLAIADRLYPLHYGRLEPQPADAFDANTAIERIKVNGDSPARAPFAGGTQLFGSRPVFDLPLDWDSGVQSTQVYTPRLAELGAQVVDEAMQKYVVNSFALPRPCWSRAEESQIELLARATYGCQQGFWLPEPERWAEVALAVDTTHFEVPGRGLVETFATEPGAVIYLWAVDAEGAGYNPITSGLIMDLDARFAVLDASGNSCTNGISAKNWNDQSASAYVTQQATVGNRPIFKTNIFKNLPALYFDGSRGLDSTTAFPGIGDITVFAVHLPDNVFSGNYERIVNSSGASNLWLMANASASGQWGGRAGGASTAIAPYGAIMAGAYATPHISHLRRVNGGASTEGMDGARATVPAVNDSGGVTGSFTLAIGHETFGSDSYRGSIGRVLIYNRALSDVEIDQVERYLSNLYGINSAVSGSNPLAHGLQVTAVATSGSNERCTVAAGQPAVALSDDLYRLRYARFANNEIVFDHDTEDTCSVALSFLEVPHEYAAVDLGQRPAWLYRITRNAVLTYWTSYDQPITVSAATWTPAAIEHGQISESVDGKQNDVVLTTWRTQPSSPFVDLAPFASTDGEILVEILRYDNQALGSTSLEWVGVVNQITLEGRKLTVSCSTRLDRLGATLPRWLIQRRCNTQLYSATCSIVRSTKQRNPTVTSVTLAGRLLRLNLTGIGSIPAQNHVYGEVKSLLEYRQIEAVTIVDANNIDVRLEHPFAVDPVVSVTVETAEGCNHSREACNTQFSNLVNFRGHAFIDENLALKAIELRSAGGKK